MKRSFYPRLAWSGIWKNRILYIPYLLTCILVVSVFYILSHLSSADMMNSAYMYGGNSTALVLRLGSFVIATFSLIFLFYTNSFLIRRRKKEFGLYNVLGMDKHNISRILLWETLMIAAAALVFGLAIGIVLSKLAELGLIRIVGAEIDFSFSVSPQAIGMTALLYCPIFLLILLNSLRQVRFANPAQLMKSEGFGEKAPKANWVLGLLGLVLLGVAYYVAVSIQNPLEAFMWFFAAVLMVIVGSYLLFIAGSVLLCRILQKNTRYYYNPRHYVSVSSMVFRMKRNGAGLASICILATMVLVMLSSTTCLYFGSEDSLRSRFPRDVAYSVDFTSTEKMSEENIAAFRDAFNDNAEKLGANRKDVLEYTETHISAVVKDGTFSFSPDDINVDGVGVYSNLVTLYFVSLDEYNRTTGQNVALADGEMLAYSSRFHKIPDRFMLGDQSWTITKWLDTFEIGDIYSMEIVPAVYFVVPDLQKAVAPLERLTDESGDVMLLRSCWCYNFNTDAPVSVQEKLDDWEGVEAILADDADMILYYNYDFVAGQRDEMYGLYGGLFFIGIMLSIVFLVAAVLIIYYKQISEGYEDQARFDIMQRIGMTKTEIRRSINSQMLTVFFLPLVFAVLHLAFAFPMIQKLLMLFNLNNLPLLLITTGISIAFFALFYLIVYRVTSNAYYRIVSGLEEDKVNL